MKSYISLFFSLFTFFTFSQERIGIGVLLPTENLDVRSNVKIRNMEQIKNDVDFSILATDTNEVVGKIDKDIYTQSLAIVKTANISSNQTLQVINPLPQESFAIIIITENTCREQMISVFHTNLGALTFINGIARDIMATTTVTSIPGGAPAYSSEWLIRFPNVRACSNGTGGGSYFDFSIKKINNNTYEIKNLGSATKSFTVYFDKM